MVIISEPLAYALIKYQKYLNAQIFIAIAMFILIIGMSASDISNLLDQPRLELLLAIAMLVYLLILLYILIYFYRYIRDYDEILMMGYKTKEINRGTLQLRNFDALFLHYKPYIDSNRDFPRDCQVQMKIRIHLYFCQIPAILHYGLLVGFFFWQQYNIAQATEKETETNTPNTSKVLLAGAISVSLIILFNVLDAFFIVCGLFTELPSRVSAYCRVRNKLRKIEEQKEFLLEQTCGICLDVNSDIMLDCHKTHCFHSKCLNEWRHVQNICPMCRKPITTNI